MTSSTFGESAGTVPVTGAITGAIMTAVHRLFVGVDPPAAAASLAGRVIGRLRGSGVDFAWLDPGRLHLTVWFLGDVATEDLPEVRRAMDEACRGRGRFVVEIGGLGAFPSDSRPRTLWLGVRRGGERLESLWKALAEAFAPLGFRPEARPYHPHLTIGRRRSGAAVPRSALEAARRLADAGGVDGPVNEVVLFESRSGPGGRTYHRVHVCELRDADAAASGISSPAG